jgi:hypothetical protein
VLRFRIRMSLGLPEPDPGQLIRGTDSDLAPGSCHHQAKIVGKLDSYCFVPFVTSFWLFIFEKWCKCTFKKLVLCWRLEGQRWKKQDPDPNQDQLVRGMYPRIRIHTKMSFDSQHCSQGIQTRLDMQWGTSCLGAAAPWTAWWRPGRGRGGARWRWTYGRSPPNQISNLIIYFIFKFKIH